VRSKLESALKEEAKKRRLTVSHLIRNMLEDTLDLVDTVVTGVDDIRRSSAGLAEQVARDAKKIAAVAREPFRRPEDDEAPAPASEPGDNARPEAANDLVDDDAGASDAPKASELDAILAWNQVVVNKATDCAQCRGELLRGSSAFLGISADPTAPPTWLCAACIENIRE
jgi:hypothetical protein